MGANDKRSLPPTDNTVVEKVKKRKERVPLGILRTKLKADQRDGYVRRWINDKPGRLDDATQSGYSFVSDPDAEMRIGDGNDVSQIGGIGTVVSRMVGTHEDGRPMKAYLMEIERDLYDEDQADKMGSLDEKEDSIRRGRDEQGRPGDGTRYVPSAGIKINHGNR